MASNKNIIKGSDAMLFIQDASGNLKSIGYASSCSVNLSANTSSVSNKSFGNGWDSQVITSRSWTASSSNLYATETDAHEVGLTELYQSYLNGTEITLMFGIDQNSGVTENRTADVDDTTNGWLPKENTPVLYGPCVISSISVTADNSDNATFDVEFAGAGELKMGTAGTDGKPVTA